MKRPNTCRQSVSPVRAAALACVLLTACASTPPPAPPAPPAPSAPAADTTAQADKLWSQRADLDRIREGIMLLRHARTSDTANYETAWRLARFAYYLGTHATDEGERDTAFREGIAAGQVAVQIAPDKADGHFWLGANIGGRTELQNLLGGLAAVEDIRREMQAVLRIDEGYQSGSAYMALGRVDLEVPEVLGGDRQRAVASLEKGLRFGDKNALLRLDLAEAYLATKRKDDARKQLRAILTMTPDPNYLPEYQQAVDGARELLGKKF